MQTPPQAEPTLLDIAAVLLRRWKRIVLVTVATTLLMVAYGLLQPESYTSRVVLVPSSSGGGDTRAQMLAAQLKLPGLAGMGGGNSSQMVVQAVLKSAALQDSVVRRVTRGAGQPRTDERTLRGILRDGTSVESDPTIRSISIEVNAHDPRLAATVAGQIPNVVNAIATQLSLEAAVRRREGLERQVDEARTRLAASEERVRVFQERHGIPEIQEQARRTVGALAEVQQRISEQEVRVAVLRRSATPDNPQYRAAVAELDAMRQQLRRTGAGGREDLLVSSSALPEIKLAMTRLVRENMLNEQVYLSMMAEMAGVQADASDEMAVVSVLDHASIPEHPSSPRLKLLAAAGVLLGLVLGVFLAFIADYLARARAIPQYESFFAEWDHVRGAPWMRGPAKSSNGRSLTS